MNGWLGWLAGVGYMDCLLTQLTYNEALNYLELALASDPEKHYILFDYLPQLQKNKVIVDIINRYTK